MRKGFVPPFGRSGGGTFATFAFGFGFSFLERLDAGFAPPLL
jgi:hypothetical protein